MVDDKSELNETATTESAPADATVEVTSDASGGEEVEAGAVAVDDVVGRRLEGRANRTIGGLA